MPYHYVIALQQADSGSPIAKLTGLAKNDPEPRFHLSAVYGGGTQNLAEFEHCLRNTPLKSNARAPIIYHPFTCVYNLSAN